MPSDKTNRATRAEWRELGFYYDRDDAARAWVLTGSRAGLLKFSDALRAYSSNPRNASQSEHEHYGPYMYLKVMTWPDAAFDEHCIRGSLADLQRLACLVESKVESTAAGASVRLQDEFAPGSPFGLVIVVREDEFDPASADAALPHDLAG